MGSHNNAEAKPWSPLYLAGALVPGFQHAVKRLADIDILCMKLQAVVTASDDNKVVEALIHNLLDRGDILDALKATYDWYISEGCL
jgi:hypothetical protein